MALSKEQLEILKGMDGIDQNLVSAYEKGGQNLSATEQEAINSRDLSPERVQEISSADFVTEENKQAIEKAFKTTVERPKVTPKQAQDKTFSLPTSQNTDVGGFAKLSAALQEAVNLGRRQRQSAELDFLKGAIPEGAISASSFTGLLANLNKASTRFTEPLVGSVLSEASKISADARDSQNDIRDLALSLIENGADQSAVNSVLSFTESGDVNGAINAAAGALKGQKLQGGKVVEKVGSSLVTYDESDPEGTIQTLYTPPKTTSASTNQSGNTGFFNSGAIRISDSDIGELASELEATRGDDGYANSELYIQAFNQWVQQGGLPQDFFKNFDPDYYLNPADPTIPPQVRSQMSESEDSAGPSNPFR